MEKIDRKINELQLPLQMGKPTPAQRNMFFQAVM